MKEIEITRLSSKGQVVIPLSMRKGLREGDRFLVILKDDEIILKKAEALTETSKMSEEAFAESWNSKEDEEAFEYLQ